MTSAVSPLNFAATVQPEPLSAVDDSNAFTSPDKLVEYLEKSMWPRFETERTRLKRIDEWYKGSQGDPNVPRGATKELRSLLALSKTPWLGLVVTTIAQAMFVDGYRSPDAVSNSSGPWTTWHANDFDNRQIAIHRAALAYGYSYVTVLPGTAPDGSSRSVLRGMSPQRFFAVYDDPAGDDFPEYAMAADPMAGGKWQISFFDDTYKHTLTMEDGTFVYGRAQAHNAGVCPVVRYCNQLDLDGRTPGEVEPFIPVASRIDKTLFDRLMVQHFNSWKVRYVAGLANFAGSEEEKNIIAANPDLTPEQVQAQMQARADASRLKLRQSDMLVAEDADTKFGTLDETGLAGFIAAAEADIESVAAVTQLPNHLLTGKMVNLSAEALAAARAPLTQKVFERQVSFGASHARVLRLAAKLEGDDVSAMDVMARVTWQDVEVRSLSQAVDALGKAAQMLGIPRQELWGRIPGVTQADVEEWKKHALDDDPLSVYLRGIEDLKATPAGDAMAGGAPVKPLPGPM